MIRASNTGEAALQHGVFARHSLPGGVFGHDDSGETCNGAPCSIAAHIWTATYMKQLQPAAVSVKLLHCSSCCCNVAFVLTWTWLGMWAVKVAHRCLCLRGSANGLPSLQSCMQGVLSDRMTSVTTWTTSNAQNQHTYTKIAQQLA